MKNFARRAKNKLGRMVPKYFMGSQYDLLIFDDAFPHPISGFRYEELNYYIANFHKIKVILSGHSYPTLGSTKEKFYQDIINYNKLNNSSKKIVFKKNFININAKLFYTLFLINIYRYLEVLEKYKIYFAFSLYPGGYFQLNQEKSDKMLRTVCNSKYFKKVIVTQKTTENYLLENNFCNSSKIEYIDGCVIPQISVNRDVDFSKYDTVSEQVNICFCAAKYMEKGVDKGYDVFIELAHKLVATSDKFHFHIVGGFTEEDIDITAISNNITFHGYQPYSNLNVIFEQIHFLISANKPFVLLPGSFDGFPLGTAIEAALNGVIIMATDFLEENKFFKDGEEIIIIDRNVENIKNKIEQLLQEPALMLSIAKNGKEKFSKVYRNEAQLLPRYNILNKLIND